MKSIYDLKEGDLVKVISGSERVREVGKLSYVQPESKDFPIRLFIIQFDDGTDFPFDETEIKAI